MTSQAWEAGYWFGNHLIVPETGVSEVTPEQEARRGLLLRQASQTGVRRGPHPVTQVKGRMMYRKTICWLHEPFHAKRRHPLRRSPDCKARAGRPRGHGSRSCISKLRMLETGEGQWDSRALHEMTVIQAQGHFSMASIYSIK